MHVNKEATQLYNNRCSGILLHPTSFPGRYGIGDAGYEARKFIDFLKKSGQSLWQILPLTPTGFGDSPYQSFSTFAGNTNLISPDLLIEEGYLAQHIKAPIFLKDRVDFGAVIQFKEALHKKAYDGFKMNASKYQRNNYAWFCNENAFWLNDYALFMAIKAHFIQLRKNDQNSAADFLDFKKKSSGLLSENEIKDYYYGAAWVSWPQELITRQKDAMGLYREKLQEEVNCIQFIQYEFFRQWKLLKSYANQNDIAIIGDIPIFVAFDSADTWANKELFLLDENGFPVEVAGVPPDYFSATGQLWGNPLYHWPNHKKNNYTWWVWRIKKTFELVDQLRIDHFRGFEANYAVPFGEKTAQNGVWRKGPDKDFFKSIQKALGKLPLIAEDLGVITPEVRALRDRFGFPGMKILQFAFDSDEGNAYLPHNFSDTKCIVYTGTHDNDTTIGWYETAAKGAKDYYRRYMNVSGNDAAWDLIRLAFQSTADYAIVPLQDFLCLAGEARMNTPSTAEQNWQWRYDAASLTGELAGSIHYLTKLYNRIARWGLKGMEQ